MTTAWSDGNSGWHLLDLQDDGTVRDRAVAGVPDGIDPMGGGDSPVGDAHGMVVQYRAGETVRSAWLDADEGKLVVLPYNPTINVTGRTVLTATHLVSWDGSTVSVYSRDDLTTAVRTVPLADDGPTHLMGMVGDTLLVCRYDSSLGAMDGSLPVWRVDGVAPDGSTTGTVLARTRSLGLAVPTPTAGCWCPAAAPTPPAGSEPGPCGLRRHPRGQAGRRRRAEAGDRPGAGPHPGRRPADRDGRRPGSGP
ncbi:hypothetical protein O1M54_24035 [Streptomyces diastatochromogenes]|nr:hypothetical protein [Streptomyces diastatochromogenes]